MTNDQTEEKLLEGRNSEIQRMNFILNYSEQKTHCRTKILLSYFGEEQKENCKYLRDCITNNKKVDMKKLTYKTVDKDYVKKNYNNSIFDLKVKIVGACEFKTNVCYLQPDLVKNG